MTEPRENVVESPDRCDDCPLVDAFMRNDEEIFMCDLQAIFDTCPGYKKGIRGALRSLGIQIKETMTNGGNVTSLDTGATRRSETFVQIGNCGTPLRRFVEIERLRPGGFGQNY